MKRNWIKESTWIFLTKLCYYYLPEDIKILCMHYQKSSQQYTEEETFLGCQDLRDFSDLKLLLHEADLLLHKIIMF